MFWQIKKDFRSLFIRDKDDNYFHPIHGLRSIANLSIILLHLVAIFSAFISPNSDAQWKNYLMSVVFALNTIMSFNLEIFFMLSSFLLTYKLINQWIKNFPNVKLYLLKKYPLSILKRAFRLWPGLFLSSLILFVFGEPRYPHSGISFELIFGGPLNFLKTCSVTYAAIFSLPIILFITQFT